MKRILSIMIVAVLILLSTPYSIYGRIDSKTIFDNVSEMTSEEIVAEMKYGVKTGKDGKYYPKDRLHELEQQLAKNQTTEIERFKDQLKKDAEVAKKVAELKQKALDKVKAKGDEWYEANKDQIQADVEDQARRMLGMSETDWVVRKDEINDMYDKGSKHYEDNYSSYVDKAKVVYNLYQTYQSGKQNHPEAPDAAQNLVGFLNATGKLLNAAGEKMDKTPLRPIGEILKMYGAATGLGDTAARAAWDYAHRDGINPNVDSQYRKGLEQAGLGDFDYGGIQKSNIMMFDKSIRILKLANGRYAVFNDKFELVPGASGNTLTPEEYQKLEQIFVSFANGKKDGWPDLNAEQLAQLAKGEKVKVTVDDNMWPFPDEIKEFTSSEVLALGENHAYTTVTDDIYTSLDRIINGEQSILGGLVDPFTRGSRIREIRDLFSEFQKNNDSFNSLIHDREAFLEWVQEIRDANKDLSPEELKEKIREAIRKLNEGEEEGEGEGEGEEGEKDDKNPLEEAISQIDPVVTGADASGVNKGDNERGNGHWTQETPEDFNGVKDGGFTNTGGTNRPMPGGNDPRNIGIPVYKPNIYLYPEKSQVVDVTFKYPERLSTFIPDYLNYWRVTAEPHGLLDNTYGFLFYEAVVPEIFFQLTEGWKLETDDRGKSFEYILNLYQFNEQEKLDFIEFWQEKLDPTVEYLVYPQETSTIDKVMPVVVEPTPDSVYRIWFYFIPYDGREIKKPSIVEVIERDGFSVVEWGGMYQ